jgi:protein TonB
MAKAIPLYRCTTFGISCLLHIAFVGGAIALGRELVTPKVPAVLIADLTLVDAPRLLEEPKAGPPAPPPRKPEKLTLPKPVATPMPAPVAEPQAVETRVPTPPAPAPAAEPSPQPREPVGGSASSTSFEAGGETSAVQVEPGVGRANSGVPAPQQSAVVRPSDAIASTAMPRGGYQVRPSYPTSARRLGIQGMTTLRVYVAADGRVSEVVVHESAGHPDLDSAAAEAVKRWRFEPARRGAEAVGVWVLLPVEFRLR